MIKTFVVFIFLSLPILGYSQKLEDFPLWLKGIWEIKSHGSVSYEEWQETNSGVLIGKTYRIISNDTIIFDNMRIFILDGKPVYEMLDNVGDKQILTEYFLEKLVENYWKFENFKANNPRSINYVKISSDTVYVWTEHYSNEAFCTDFIMVKKK